MQRKISFVIKPYFIELVYILIMEKAHTIHSNLRVLFSYYKKLGAQAFAQVADDKLFFMYNEDSNSIASIVKHLHGNMMSRFTDFLDSDGEKKWRRRDEEFVNDIKSREEMIHKWEEGWTVVFEALDVSEDEDPSRLIYIRNQGHSIQEALLRQVTHYAYHIGQIVYLSKMFCKDDWKSLSIPLGKSSEFNAKTFAKGKRKEHFSDPYMKESND